MIEIERNRVDGLFHASYETERLKIGVYPFINSRPDSTKRINFQSYYLYKNRECSINWDGYKFSNLKGKLSTVRGYGVIHFLNRLGYKVEEEKNQEINLLKLKKGRIMGFIAVESMADPILKKKNDFFKGIEKIEPPVLSQHYYLIFSHKLYNNNKELCIDIWNEIEIILNSDKYKQIRAKYL